MDDREELTEEQLVAYHAFIDKMVECARHVELRWIAEVIYPDVSAENRNINEFLGSLTEDQRSLVVIIARSVAQGVAHDMLFALHDDRYQVVSPEGIKMPFMPHFNHWAYDFVSRLSGEEWEEVQF